MYSDSMLSVDFSIYVALTTEEALHSANAHEAAAQHVMSAVNISTEVIGADHMRTCRSHGVGDRTIPRLSSTSPVMDHPT